MTAPRVSCVIPTYNRWPWVGEAVESVLGQTFPELECIVVDDGSTDGSAERLAERFPDVRLIRQENRGVSAARNAGVDAARGEWLAFLDSDDTWLTEKLERQLAFVDARPDCRICQTDEIWIRNGKRVNQMDKHRKGEGDCFARSLELCVISPSTVMLRRDLLEEVGGFDEAFPVCEDYELWLRIARRERVGLLAEPLTVKRGGHADQLSRSRAVMDGFRIRAMLKLLESGLPTPEQVGLTLAELERKCQIVASGCRKRGKDDEADEWLRRLAAAQARWV